jgi:steroid delta-isomerase-like uncharacterized protein
MLLDAGRSIGQRGEEANKVIARRFFDEVLNRGDLAASAELLAEGLVWSSTLCPKAGGGLEGFRRFVVMLRSACPDFHLAVEHLLAEGDTVVAHWLGSGTHTGGPLSTGPGEVPAGGRPFVIDGMTWLRIAGGKIVEALANEDALGLLQQLGALPSPAPAPGTTSPEDNKVIARRYFEELLSEGKLSLAEELFTADCAFRIPTLPSPVRGQEGMKQFVAGLRGAFPDIRFRVEQIIAEGDKVAARWTITGTHRNAFLGIAPTGQAIRDQGIDIFRIAGGKIAEVWVNENDLALLQQLGAVPTRFAQQAPGRSPS